MPEKKAPLYSVIDHFNFDLAAKKLLETRKVEDEGDSVTYTEISHNVGDKTLKLRGTHVSYSEVHKMANNKCNTCRGKGYYVHNILKSKLKDPVGHMVMEEQIPEGLSEEQKKIWQVKIEKTPTWKIVSNCLCAVNKFLRKNDDVLVNGNHNIFVRIDYDFVPLEIAPEEPKKVEAVTPVDTVPEKVEEPVDTTPKNIYVDAQAAVDSKQE